MTAGKPARRWHHVPRRSDEEVRTRRARVCALFKAAPGRPIRSVAWELGVSVETIKTDRDRLGLVDPRYRHERWQASTLPVLVHISDRVGPVTAYDIAEATGRSYQGVCSSLRIALRKGLVRVNGKLPTGHGPRRILALTAAGWRAVNDWEDQR